MSRPSSLVEAPTAPLEQPGLPVLGSTTAVLVRLLTCCQLLSLPRPGPCALTSPSSLHACAKMLTCAGACAESDLSPHPLLGVIEKRDSRPLLDVLEAVGGWPVIMDKWNEKKGEARPGDSLEERWAQHRGLPGAQVLGEATHLPAASSQGVPRGPSLPAPTPGPQEPGSGSETGESAICAWGSLCLGLPVAGLWLCRGRPPGSRLPAQGVLGTPPTRGRSDQEQ